MRKSTDLKKSNMEAARAKASTSDILGGSGRQRRIKSEWREHYDRLRELREEMTTNKRQLASDAREERATASIHMADAASDTYDCDWALSMLSSDQNALYEIDEAMQRIESGDYGVCELTGEPIEAERLTAIPWTRFSMQAQRQLEDEGAVGRTRMAERRGLSEVSDTAEVEDEPEGVAT